ncbi:MAG: RNA pseudouridine synthase [Clostridia bacterium]|nr:RNA pseudouridine synthase [Clostridia bacterium]
MKNTETELRVARLAPEYIVLVKPCGVSSGEDGVMPAVRRLLDERGEKNDLYPVHRLDRETEGLMVFARTKECAAFLSEQIRCGGFEKTYIAELSGVPAEEEGTLRDLLFHDRKRNKTYVADRPRKGVKEAALHYSVIKETENGCLVRVRLETGRTHQIRVQFASRGFPLVGDRKYGGPKADRLRLTASELRFTAPDGEKTEFRY